MTKNKFLKIFLMGLFFFGTLGNVRAETHDQPAETQEGDSAVIENSLSLKNNGLVYNLNPSPCYSVKQTAFITARHAGGRRGLNEKTHGVLNECWFNKDETVYTSVGGLINSQNGATFVAGTGFRLRTPELLRLRLVGGVEMMFIHYEIPKRQAYVYGVLPIGYIGLEARLGKDLRIEAGVRLLAQGKEQVALISLTVHGSF